MNKKKLSCMTYQEKKNLYLKYSGIMFSMMGQSSRYISANKWDDSFHIMSRCNRVGRRCCKLWAVLSDDEKKEFDGLVRELYPIPRR